MQFSLLLISKSDVNVCAATILLRASMCILHCVRMVVATIKRIASMVAAKILPRAGMGVATILPWKYG